MDAPDITIEIQADGTAIVTRRGQIVDMPLNIERVTLEAIDATLLSGLVDKFIHAASGNGTHEEWYEGA